MSKWYDSKVHRIRKSASCPEFLFFIKVVFKVNIMERHSKAISKEQPDIILKVESRVT